MNVFAQYDSGSLYWVQEKLIDEKTNKKSHEFVPFISVFALYRGKRGS